MIVNHQGSSHFFFFFFPASTVGTFVFDIDDSGRDIADCDRLVSIKKDDPGLSKSNELLTRGLTSAIEVERSGFDFIASSTREGLNFLGRDFRKRVISKKFTGNMIRFDMTPMKI